VLIKWWKPYFTGEKHMALSLAGKEICISNESAEED